VPRHDVLEAAVALEGPLGAEVVGADEEGRGEREGPRPVEEGGVEHEVRGRVEPLGPGGRPLGPSGYRAADDDA